MIITVDPPRVLAGDPFDYYSVGALVIALDHAGRFAAAGVFAPHGAAVVELSEELCKHLQDQNHIVRGNAPLRSFSPRSQRTKKRRARSAEHRYTPSSSA